MIPPEPLELLRNLVADQPGNEEAVAKLVGLYEKENKYEDLAQLLTERVGYFESRGLAADQLTNELRLVEIYRDQLGETGKAVTVLEDVLARNPDEVSALSQLATLQETLGHPAEAGEVLSRPRRLFGGRRESAVCQTSGDNLHIHG